MFKFNFSVGSQQNVPPEHIPDQNSKKLKTKSNNVVKIEHGVIKFDELTSATHLHMVRDVIFKKMDIDLQSSNREKETSNTIDYVDSYNLKIDKENDLAEINRTHDLVPGKYEGGLKVWELSIDLARFLYNINIFDLDKSHFKCLDGRTLLQFHSIQNFFKRFSKNHDDQEEIRILELGCGHALPSLSICKYLSDVMYETYAKSKATKKLKIIVHLQDFNKQIVEDITFENVKKFMEQIKEKWAQISLEEMPFEIIPELVYGDWKDLHDKDTLPKDFYNLILSSETIYNSENYRSLLDLFKKCLVKKENEALVLLSSKTYYFGCGGNIKAFSQLAKTKEYGFNSSDNLLYSDDIYLDDTLDTTPHSNKNSSENDAKLSGELCSEIGKEIIQMTLETQ